MFLGGAVGFFHWRVLHAHDLNRQHDRPSSKSVWPNLGNLRDHCMHLPCVLFVVAVLEVCFCLFLFCVLLVLLVLVLPAVLEFENGGLEEATFLMNKRVKLEWIGFDEYFL